jgi:CreA protein
MSYFRITTAHVATLFIATMITVVPVSAEKIGSVDTKFELLGPDSKVAIEAFDDEKIPGVSCHISRAVTGGLKGAVGLAEDSSDASIACRQVGPITISGKLKAGEDVFSERRSIMFKRLQVVRFCDEKRNTLIYLVYSDTLVDGSPKNSISTVPISPWGNTGEVPQCNDETSGWFGKD